MTAELLAASSLPPGELAALFTRAYEGYYVPVQVDEAAVDFLVRTFDLPCNLFLGRKSLPKIED